MYFFKLRIDTEQIIDDVFSLSLFFIEMSANKISAIIIFDVKSWQLSKFKGWQLSSVTLV